MVLGKIGFRCRSFGDDKQLVFQLVNGCNVGFCRRNNAEGDFHIRQGEVHLLRSFLSDSEIGEDDIYFSRFRVFYTVRRFKGDIFRFYAQVFGETLGEVYIISLIISILVNVAERRFVTEYADNQLSTLLNVRDGTERGFRRSLFIIGIFASAACGKGHGTYERNDGEDVR